MMAAFDVRSFLATLTTRPGVYRMLSAGGEILYVGKARNLKSRVGSYFSNRGHNTKTMAMVEQIAAIEVTATASDSEALLLEFNLIKQHRPRYNVALRDDKSFPYLYLTTQQEYPRLTFYRGSRRMPGRFFGPYPSARATRETQLILQKLFKLRSCEDTFFANRTRPCLQYQIQRCSAPCVGLVPAAEYRQDVDDAMAVLEGRDRELRDDLARRMEGAAATLDYERAARIRDQIQAIKDVQASQAVTRLSGQDIDAVSLHSESGRHCVATVFIRGGRNLGSTSFFPKAGLAEAGELLSAFLAQYYLTRDVPQEILIGEPIEDRDVLEAAFSERAGRPVEIRDRVRGVRARWLEMARSNAELALRMREANAATVGEQLSAVGEALGMSGAPLRVECFDISHTSGELTVASCVVLGPEGPLKSDYRRFNITGLAPGDDYGALRQALTRRYVRIKRGEAPLPDLLLIDGGPGQLKEAIAVLHELEITGITVVGVAKGADRRPGQERLFLAGQEVPTILAPDSPALHLIQRVRDEAHRFAITGHRQRRAKARRESILESVTGLGPSKRRELLRQFGGLQGVAKAGIEDLAQVRGISRQLAELVYATLHPGA